MNEQWEAVDDYFDESIVAQDSALTNALKASEDAGLPRVNVTASQGKLLHLLATMGNARNILEIGTLGGYSTIWLARALPADGRLITLEANENHATVARANIAAAGLADRVDVRLGKASDTLPVLAEENRGPFDLVFIDADKQSNPDYFAWAVKLTRPGSVIVVDNVVRGGEVANSDSADPAVVGTRKMVADIARNNAVSATAIQTVGGKGYDGFLLAVVTGNEF
ncbi:MAG: O-methyltransferase [Sciscionella sp.]|nr:O-methyltransferase [Sciscionella sp.]